MFATQFVLVLLKKELQLSKLQNEIKESVEEKMKGEQRKFLLKQQLKAIKKELGLEQDDKEMVLKKFNDRIEKCGRDNIPKESLKVIDEEISKLTSLEKDSSEFNITRNYLDWLTQMPWVHK